MTGLVFYWSQAAFLAFVAAIVFRPAAGDTLSPLRRRGFAALLGASMAALAVLATRMAAPSADLPWLEPEPVVHVRTVLLAGVAGAAFACMVNATLQRPASGGASPRVLGALLALAAILPAAVLLVPPRAAEARGSDDSGRPPPLVLAPSLDEVAREVESSRCGASWRRGPVHAHIACAAARDLYVERQWIISTELRMEGAPLLYLVRVCALEDRFDLLPACRYSVEGTQPGSADIDLLPRISGTRVDASEPLEARYQPEQGWWVVEPPHAAVDSDQRIVVDARSPGLNIAHAVVPTARRLRFPPAPWAILLGLWALGAALTLRAHRAAARRHADLERARRGDLRDGLVHVEGEDAPRQLVAPPQDAIHHLRGPVVWNARVAAGAGVAGVAVSADLVGYRRSALAHLADLTAGDLDEHKERAAAAGRRAFALFAALLGGGALPVLVAALGHLANAAPTIHFRAKDVKSFADTTDVCPRGATLVDGSKLTSPSDEKLAPAPQSFCLDEGQVAVASYRACVESGGCFPPSLAAGPRCNWSRADAAPGEPMNCVTRNEAAQFCDHERRQLGTTLESPDQVARPPWDCSGDRCPEEVHADERACDADADACGMGLIPDTRGAAEDKGFRCVSEPLTLDLYGWR